MTESPSFIIDTYVNPYALLVCAKDVIDAKSSDYSSFWLLSNS